MMPFIRNWNVAIQPCGRCVSRRWKKTPEFAVVRNSRSEVEYFFMMSPVLPLWLFQKNPEIDLLCYLDADLLFFHSSEAAFAELGSCSLLITEHDFTADAQNKSGKFGQFNVAFQIYRRDAVALQCLAR